MTFYHPTKDAALMAGLLYEDHFTTRAELEPDNGWVLVLAPKSMAVFAYPLAPILEHAEVELTSYGRLRKRPLTHRKSPAPPPKGRKGDISPTSRDSGARPLSGATARVHAIADRLNEENTLVRADRGLVIAACVEAGINKSTAATQWSKWAKEKGL